VEAAATTMPQHVLVQERMRCAPPFRTGGFVADTAELVGASGVAAHSQFAQVRMSGTGLQIPVNLNYEDWAKAGRQLSGIVDSSAWWLGDWLVFGKANYSDRYQLAIQNAGLRYQTLRNYAWVARRFEADRRRAKLTFRHHAEVASLPFEEQERLLDLAERELWTTKQLRNAIQQDRGGEADKPALVEVNSRIDVPSSRVGMWRKAADHAGIDFDQWVLTMLDRAATEVLVHEYADRGVEVPA
jgi:transposase